MTGLPPFLEKVETWKSQEIQKWSGNMQKVRENPGKNHGVCM